MTNDTAVTPHPTWSLPHRAHPKQPTSPDLQMQWAVESLIDFYVQSDASDLIDVLHAFRPDLTHAQMFEAVERLCALSVDVADLRDNSAARWPAYDSAADEYASALAALATRPVSS